MHTLLGLASLLLVLAASYLGLGLLRRTKGWAARRDLQLLVLAAPVVSLALGIAGLHHFVGRACFLGAPPWDYTLGIALPLVTGLVALGGLGLGLARLALMDRVVAGRGRLASAELQARADALARRLGAPAAPVRVCACEQPLALTVGFRRPTVLLSTWMVAHLDDRELEAVLAHELGHVARRDYPVVWLATVLRDAFCYLPTSWLAHRQLQAEKELACDDLAVGATERPLPLASALAKVWQRSLGVAVPAGAQPLTGAAASIEDRIERLLATPAPDGVVLRRAGERPQRRLAALGVGAAALAGLLAVQALNAAVMLAPMGCGLVGPLGVFS